MALQNSIEKWLRDATTRHPDHVSADGSAVRIYTDVGGAAFLRPDGSLLFEGFDSGPYKELDPRLHTAALVAGARQHPELLELLPHRPHDATTCGTCSGTGYELQHVICGGCGGLGWQPAA